LRSQNHFHIFSAIVAPIKKKYACIIGFPKHVERDCGFFRELRIRYLARSNAFHEI
jgi:hypothetical protein